MYGLLQFAFLYMAYTKVTTESKKNNYWELACSKM